MRTHSLVTLGIVIAITLSLSGCTNFISGPTTYVAHPVQISYTIKYGYYINTTGTGQYKVGYTCDLPEVLIGNTSIPILLNSTGAKHWDRLDNPVITWNISSHGVHDYILGVQADVNAQTYLFPDLNGKDASSLEQLRAVDEDYINRYTQVQGNSSVRFIDPGDPQIKEIANGVLNESSTNSLLLAKALFKWLKENVHYQTHASVGVQPAARTLALKTGDCDDLSFLYISLCRAVDIPARFIRGYLISDSPSAQPVAHAWVEVFVGRGVGVSGWIPVECSSIASSVETDIEQNFGVEDCFHLRVYTDQGNNASLDADLSGIVFTQNVEVPTSFAVVQYYQVVSSRELLVASNGTRSFG